MNPNLANELGHHLVETLENRTVGNVARIMRYLSSTLYTIVENLVGIGSCYITICWFLEMGVPPVIIHLNWIFHERNHPAMGVTPFMETSIYPVSSCRGQILVVAV